MTHMAGVVRDADRKPIAGATVSLRRTFGFKQTRPDANGRGITDAEGRYRLGFYTRPGGSVEVLGVSAVAEGFVRVDGDFEAARPVMRPGETTELNLVLTRGEVVAGVVEVPERLGDRAGGVQSDAGVYALRVRGPSFTQVHITKPGGAFELWVPGGTYDLELNGRPGEAPEAVLKGVRSGTRGLRLAKVDPPAEADVLARAFDALWEDMGRNYSYFELKKIDWPALKEKYRPRAVAAGSVPKFVDVLGEMLGELNDGHVWFAAPPGAVVAYKPPERKLDINPRATVGAILDPARVGDAFLVGTTGPEGFGVIFVTRQSRATEGDVTKVVEFLRAHAEAPGFVVDLRGANGGNELLARRIAKEFCEESTVYAKSKYRDGPGPGDFGPTYERVLEAGDDPYRKPVVCILGPGCVSSGEGFAKMMACLPRVTTVGLPTRGSSGNPKPFELPGVGVTVLYSRWVDMMPDGTPVEGRGVRPEVVVDRPPSDYEKGDPTWERAVEVLRSKAKAGE
jgi:hypothetical protein